MKNLSFLLAALILIVSSCSSKKSMKKEAQQNFETIKYSEYGGAVDDSTQWVQNEQEWTKVWQTLHAGQTPLPALPKINFTQHSLIVFNFGQKSTGGYKYSVKEVDNNNEGLTVTFLSPKKDPTQPVAMVMTNPYLILSIKKTQNEPVERKFVQE